MTRHTKPQVDEKWAIAQLHEVWRWAIANNRHFVAYLIGVAILAFDHDNGRGQFKPPRLDDGPDKPNKVK
ncbi:MAG: hypothetical protein KBA31_01325 [Alphaproteobacteria bacterium]|nr:hypothetical protein [Alphaproteobacteria bacterium]